MAHEDIYEQTLIPVVCSIKQHCNPSLAFDEKALNIAVIRRLIMRTVKFTFWQDGEFFVGFLNEYPDYQTQGMHKEELAENLKDLLNDLESGHVPYVRKVEELMVA